MSLTREEQKILARQLADGLYRYIETRIDNEKIPEEWDGIELRMLVADLASENINYARVDRKRKRDYKNTRMVNGF